MEEQILFTNKLGLRLSGVVSRPAIGGAIPLVVTCHGFGSGKNSRTNRLLVQRLNSLGIASLRFDFTGHYDSEGEIAELTISRGIDDLRSALERAKEYDWIDLRSLGLFGASYGGNVVLWYAAAYNEVSAIALKAPVSDYAAVRQLQLGHDGIMEWKQRGSVLVEGGAGEIRTNYAFYQDARSRDTYQLAKAIRAPCLIIHGDKDENVPVEQSVRLANALGHGARLEIAPNARHGFKQPGQLEMVVNLTADFFRQHLLQ